MSTREVTTEALTGTEAMDFDDAERVIKKGLARFVEVGQALETIRDRRLYREEFSSFEDYLQGRWKISRSYAYRQIDAAQVAGIVSPTGDIPAPASERVARELGPVKHQPEQVRQAWQEAVQEHGSTPTANQVRQVVSRKQIPARPPRRPSQAQRRKDGQRCAAEVLKALEVVRDWVRFAGLGTAAPLEAFGAAMEILRDTDKLGEIEDAQQALHRLAEAVRQHDET